jgi:Zn-dependent protease
VYTATTMDFSSNFITGASLLVLILASLSVHEFAHAFVANLFGDSTARLEGRMSLNPLRHWDPVGTSLLVGLLLLRMVGLPLPVFGWGKPVPVNERNFENPKIHGLQTALAGPMSNFILAVALALVARYLTLSTTLSGILVLGIYLNIFLMFFNLIPVPPLDGSRILRLFISEEAYYSISNNPMIFFAIFFFILYFLLDYIIIFSQQLTSYLIGI